MATPNPGVEISQKKTEQLFPQNLPMIFGPLDPATTTATQQQQTCQPYPQTQTPALSSILFPNNIKFLCEYFRCIFWTNFKVSRNFWRLCFMDCIKKKILNTSGAHYFFTK